MNKLTHITFDYTQALTFFREEDVHNMQDRVEKIHNQLHTRSKTENDYKGWVDLPITYDKAEFGRIQQAAKKIQAHSDILLVIGVGGSYLGSKAAMDFIEAIETKLGKTAKKNFMELQPGDVPETYANVEDLYRDIEFQPQTRIQDGINNFIDWYLDYYEVKQ